MNEKVKHELEKLKIFLDPKEVYSVGSHMCGLRHDIIPSEDLITSILNNGLTFKIREGVGLTGTVHMLGSEDFESKLDAVFNNLYNKVNNGELPAGVIVAVPGSLKDIDGKDYFIGTYPNDLDFIAKDDKRIKKLPVEEYTLKLGGVPKEFILGVIAKIDGETIVCGNNEYISYLDSDRQTLFLNRMKQANVRISTVEESKTNYSKSNAILGKDYVIAGNYLSEAAIQYEKDKEKRIAEYEKLNAEYQAAIR